MAVAMAAPSPSVPERMPRWYERVAIRWVAFTGPPRVIAQINWKSVKVNSTEKVMTTAMIGVRSGRVIREKICQFEAPSSVAAS